MRCRHIDKFNSSEIIKLCVTWFLFFLLWFSENEKTGNLNSIDPKSMHHTEDPACSDVSLHTKNFLNSGSTQNVPIDPTKHVGGLLLSSNEINVNQLLCVFILLILFLPFYLFILLVFFNTDMLFIQFAADHIYYNESGNFKWM